ncbi:hypothetical protein KDN24_06900 [Bacillus sp. Bva_UNVM-123]|uniref:DNA ligase LigA-related protein n=1 Tax=Bacillus sp. Bva_UNVM-123 TaxID=2829798 RepID=UPI00391F0372
MNEIEELIHRRRRQILIHSYLYYQMNTSLISDITYDTWCNQLTHLQKKHPNESSSVEFYRNEFADFDGATGYHLPKEAWMHDICARLITEHKRFKNN